MHITLKLLFALALALSFVAGAGAAEKDTEEDYPKCFISHERWDTSSTRVEVIFILDAEFKRARFLNLAYMLVAIEYFSAEGYNIKTAEIKMLDYSTFGSENEQLLKLKDAGNNIFIIFTEDKLAGSAAPYMAAFPSLEAAGAALVAQELSGEVLSWNKAIDKLVQAMLSDEEEMPEAMGDFF